MVSWTLTVAVLHIARVAGVTQVDACLRCGYARDPTHSSRVCDLGDS